MILFLLCFLEDYCKKNAVLAAGRNHSVTVSGIIKYGIAGVEYLNMILECYLEAAADNIIKFLSLVGREGYGLILILVRIRRGYKEGLAIFVLEAIAEVGIVESRAALHRQSLALADY